MRHDGPGTRKLIGVTLCALPLALSYRAEAQGPKKIPRIGFVAASGDPKTPAASLEAFRQGLRDLGYIEGKNIVVEHRSAEGKPDRFPRLVAELVQLKVDVLISGNLPSIRAAKQATKTIPIVMVTTADPVANGLIDTLARPGGNITGLSTLSTDLSGKRLELLKEVVPGILRVGVLWDVDAPSPAIAFKEYKTAAPALKIQLQSIEIRGPNPDLEGAFQGAVKGRASALIATLSSLLFPYTKRIGELAIKNRLPLMHESSQYVEAGGLMSYATNTADQYRRAATYVDKILKGAKPSDLPVEQPTKFEFVINLKTAQALNLTIPQSVLYRADKVIK